MVTIKEIAKECNVSVATVSNILNHKPGASAETRRIVMAKIKELNYKPNTVARNLKTKNTRTIGVIVEDMTIFSIPDIVDGITEHCEENNYQILLINLRLFKKYNDFYYHRDDYYGRVEQEIDKLIARQVEGVIYVTAHERVMKCIPEGLPVPAVMAYGYTQNKNIPSVVVNDEDGAHQIVKCLIDNGHRKIGIITGNRIVFIHRKDFWVCSEHFMRIRSCIIRKWYIMGTGADKVVIMVRINCWNRELQQSAA